MDDDLRAIEGEWSEAFQKIIKLARSIRYKMFEPGVAEKFGREAGFILAEAGLTIDEAKDYTVRILASVMQENHA